VVSASPILAIIVLIMYAIGGMAIGALSGRLTSLITRCGPTGIWMDALLGSGGFLAGLVVAVFMPWHENTISEQLEGGTTITTTTNTYQHPQRIAIVMAVLLPLLHELYRFWRMRISKK
jgi:hypothetical protein